MPPSTSQQLGKLCLSSQYNSLPLPSPLEHFPLLFPPLNNCPAGDEHAYEATDSFELPGSTARQALQHGRFEKLLKLKVGAVVGPPSVGREEWLLVVDEWPMNWSALRSKWPPTNQFVYKSISVCK